MGYSLTMLTANPRLVCFAKRPPTQQDVAFCCYDNAVLWRACLQNYCWRYSHAHKMSFLATA